MKFTVILEEGEDGYIIAHVPALKGCHIQRKTRDEAFANTKEAIEAYIGSLRKHNEPIPEDVNAVIMDA
ncbi:MAG: type II toxin-antitoxin system HicB family antitoxin [Cuniculiplasma sp.]